MVVFKFFGRFHVHTPGAIVFNYFVAATLSFGLNSSPVGFSDSIHQPWYFHALFMGILFITLFNVIGISTQKIGVSVTTVANKMSLIIPVLYAVIALGESVNAIKIGGILLALVAVVLTSRTAERNDIDKRYAFFPLIVFIGSGFIDAFFKYNEEHTLGEHGLEPFTGWIFFTASILGIGFLMYQYLREKRIPGWREMLGGIALGVPNYFSVFFLLKALSMEHMESSVVIPVNNMSIVGLSAVLGILVFGEKVSRTNVLGIMLCLFSIAMIAFSDALLAVFA